MANNEYDLTFKKFTELEDGSGDITSADKIIIGDVSDNKNPKIWTVQDMLDLVGSEDLGLAKSVQVAVSLAEVNAGKTIIPAVTGKQILVLDFNFVMDGSFAAVTSVELEDSSATVNVCSLAQAQMTDDAVLSKDTTGVTMGVGLAEGITVSEALVLTKTGLDATTATGLTVAITYMLV